MPDNYVDKSFLAEMKKNLYLRSYTYSGLVRATGRITQQLNAIIIFIMCYVHLSNGSLEPSLLHLFSISITLSCYLVLTLMKVGDALSEINAVVVFCVASFALSPILMTLTDTISTDTIYAMTTVTLLSHLLLHDYTEYATQISGVVSFNAGVFATVCLVSRLSTVQRAFALIVLSVQTFALWPYTRRLLRSCLPWTVDAVISLGMALLAIRMLSQSTVAISILAALLNAFITFICPYLLLTLQQFKNNIYGPWDEAVVVTR